MTEEVEQDGRIKRIADETRALVDDVKSWVDLRIQLTQLEVEGKVNDASAKAIVVVVGLAALFFALVGLALLIGDLTGRSWLGFFSVAGLLLLVTLLVWLAKPRVVRIEHRDDNR
ncbi:MAG: phage holin family protein [Bacteroidetes bacterium]|nr:phage holin family protein [Bacteroidota bacterium]